MLYVSFKKIGMGYPAQELEWHVGEHVMDLDDDKFEVLSVQADCDELEWIDKNVRGIPWNKSRVVKWHGDFAKFIYYSLPRV